MTDIPSLTGPSYGPAAGGPARRLVVLLHGLGADGNDLIALAPHLAQVLPDAEFVAPNAPQRCDMAPTGYQWFSLQRFDSASILAGVEATAPVLDAFLTEALAARGLTEAALALIGFSQGTMMALHVAPRRAQPVAGVLGYSGLLPGDALPAAEVRSRPPVLLVHGEADPIVPFPAMAVAERGLDAAGVPVQAIGRPGVAHGIDQEGLRLGAAFLAKVFGAGG
ncbi:MAG: phospholipase [Deinococcus-Thermus bacterium]|nr:phospholipase [Deinococcota bacterium]